MCHETGSRPPAPPVVGEVASTAELRLTAPDGAVLAAFEAVPAGEPRAAVVVLPDIRGLHPYYRALAERLAEAGYHAVAIDYFARSAGASMREEGFDWQAHVPLVTAEHVLADVTAAAGHVSPDGTLPVLTLGFCFGGGHSWGLAGSVLAADGTLAGAIGFYGRPALLSERAADVAAPVLMLVAGADHAIAPADVVAVADDVRAGGADVEVHVYDGAPHSFFDRTFADHADACTDAWRRIVAFTDRVAGGPPPVAAG